MVAREEFAGRMVKCPQCGAIVQIPNVGLSDLTRSPTPTHLARSPEIIPFKSEAEKARGEQAPRRFEATAAGVPDGHPWKDRSLMQDPTPWLPGDEQRFQRGIRAASAGAWGGILIGVVIVLLLAAAAFVFLNR